MILTAAYSSQYECSDLSLRLGTGGFWVYGCSADEMPQNGGNSSYNANVLLVA